MSGGLTKTKRKSKYNLIETYKYADKSGFLLLGYFIVKIVFSRGKTDISAVDGSAVVFAFYAMLCGFYAWNDLHRDASSKAFFKLLLSKSPMKWFVLYSILCFISCLWSPFLVLTAYRAVECIGMMLIIASTIKTLVLKCSYQEIMQWCATYVFLVVLLSFMGGLTSGIGIALYSCQFPATIFFYLAFYYAPTFYNRYFVMTVAVLCKSVTGYVGMTLGMVSLLFGNAKYRVMAVIIGVGLIAAFSTYGVEEVLNSTIFASKGGVLVDGQIDDNKTSGRNDVWEKATATVIEENKEWIGYGFVAGETMMARRIINVTVIGMHNGFLSAYVGTGIIGFVLFSLFMLNAFILTFKNKIPKDYRPPLIACILTLMVHTYGNPGLGFRVYGTWMPAMFIIVLLIGLHFKSKYFRNTPK